MKKTFIFFFLAMMACITMWEFVSKPLMGLGHQENHNWRKVAQSVYLLLIEDLQEMPQDQWDRYIETIQLQFGFPIFLDKLIELQLSPAEFNQLRNGRMLEKKHGSIFYKRVGNSKHAVRLEPDDPSASFFQFDLIGWVSIMISSGLMALILTSLFWLKLRKISVAAEAFGKGDFSARAQLPTKSYLAPLAQSFNNMAKRIQHLINSHKELTRAVSHELRTPISRIRFSLEMIETAPNRKQQKCYISEIKKDVDELNTMVSELLVYARFDRENPNIRLIEQPIASWLVEITKMAEKGFKDITFQHSVSWEDLNLNVWFEPRFMGRAVTNLVRNAARYAKSQVCVAFEKIDHDCLIHVDDDGPGIPGSERYRIFQPFVRLDASRSRDTGGFGLGLAIVKRAVSWHDGNVSIDKSPLGGARFTIRWRGLTPNT
jgi:signal transduction histidine kinase